MRRPRFKPFQFPELRFTLKRLGTVLLTLVLGSLGGIVIDHTLGSPVTRFFESREREQKRPDEMLASADSLRGLWTETDLSAAVGRYKEVLAAAPTRKLQ